MRARAALAVGAGLLLSACATVPTGPSLMALPGTGKSFDQFQGDDAACRQWALQQTGTTTEKATKDSLVSGAAVGTLIGAAAGAAIGAAAGNPGSGAAIGGGAGLLGGSAVGAGQAEAAHRTVQGRYDAAYVQCMYARGHKVPVARGFKPVQARSAAQLPPGIPPPPPGPPPPPPPAGSSPPPPPAGAPPAAPPR